jgi:hypothetical protein
MPIDSNPKPSTQGAPAAVQPTPEKTAHIEPSPHSTKEVDEKLREVERKVASAPGAGAPVTKPNTDLDAEGKPASEAPHNPRT